MVILFNGQVFSIEKPCLFLFYISKYFCDERSWSTMWGNHVEIHLSTFCGFTWHFPNGITLIYQTWFSSTRASNPSRQNESCTINVKRMQLKSEWPIWRHRYQPDIVTFSLFTRSPATHHQDHSTFPYHLHLHAEACSYILYKGGTWINEKEINTQNMATKSRYSHDSPVISLSCNISACAPITLRFRHRCLALMLVPFLSSAEV